MTVCSVGWLPAVAAAQSSVAGNSQAALYQFSIPRQSLDGALADFARRTGLQVARFSDTDAVKTNPVAGSYTAGQALDLMLAGTALTHRLVNDHTIAIVRRDVPSDQSATVGTAAVPRLASETNERDTRTMKHSNIFARFVAFVGSIAAAMSAPALHAQTVSGEAASATLEEVVVTAEHRDSSVQKAALSVTAISGEDIARIGNADIAQVLQNVPSLVLQNVSGGNSTVSVQGAGGPPNIAIRGLGTDGPNRAGSVAVYEDGILMQGGGANIYDMSRVEVLRGPQGTLYGRGATAGAVNFITNDPTKNLEAAGRIQYGSYDLIATQGMLNVPFTDALSARVAFNQVRHRGYFNNGQSDEDDINGRVKLRYSPGDNFSLTLGGVIYQSSATGPGAAIISIANPSPSDWTTILPGGTESPNSYRKIYADLEANLGFANLTYLGGYQTSHSYFSSFCQCFGGGTYVVVDSPYNNTQTHELRLASNGDTALSWQAGAYFYHNRLQQQFRLSTAAPAVGAGDTPFTTNLQHYSPTSLGVFGEVTYDLSQAYRVTAGVRETKDHLVQDQFSVGFGMSGPLQTTLDAPSDQTHINRFDWKLRGEADLSADNLLYLTASTGYRPGAVVQGVISANESVRAYEFGSKNRLGGTMTLNGAVFYNDYSGFQNVFTQPGPTGALVTTIISLPATFYGVELEFAAQLGPDDKLTFSPTYESAKFTASCLTCVLGMGSSAPAPVLSKDKDLPHAPRFLASGSYEHSFALTGGARLTWGIDAHYQTEQTTDFDPSNYPTPNPPYLQGAYTIFDSSLTFAPESGKYSLTAYGRNLGNKIYKVAAANANPAGAPPNFADFVGDPRTFGVMISAKL